VNILLKYFLNDNYFYRRYTQYDISCCYARTRIHVLYNNLFELKQRKKIPIISILPAHTPYTIYHTHHIDNVVRKLTDLITYFSKISTDEITLVLLKIRTRATTSCRVAPRSYLLYTMLHALYVTNVRGLIIRVDARTCIIDDGQQ